MRSRDPLTVKDLFNTVSPTYDILNDLFSFGLHRNWKRHLLSLLKPSLEEKWVDLCCGTGDLSIALAHYLGQKGSVVGVDFSKKQLEVARKRALKRSIHSVSWLQADVLVNALPSNSFDGAVMAYGLRNLSSPEAGLKEIYRLLKPGSRAGVLDFNHAKKGTVNAFFQKCYLRKLVVPIASLLGLREHYSYLEKSLKTFPSGFAQQSMARSIGFEKVSYKLIAGGQMGVLLLKT